MSLGEHSSTPTGYVSVQYRGAIPASRDRLTRRQKQPRTIWIVFYLTVRRPIRSLCDGGKGYPRTSKLHERALAWCQLTVFPVTHLTGGFDHEKWKRGNCRS